ncbi:MAG: hypothetical protein GEU79_02885 [Acidimicrobiia bacterium]|nr:hypothetical protein [Acidimicrobiia bacterium]
MEALVAAHSGIRWLVIVGLLVVLLWAFAGKQRHQPTWVRIVGGLFSLQVLLGIVLYVINEGWSQGGFIAIWHPIGMIAALAAFQIGTGRSRSESNPRMLGIATLISIVLVLAAVPWPRGMM